MCLIYLDINNGLNCIDFVNSRWHEYYELRKQIKKQFVFTINALDVDNYLKQ